MERQYALLREAIGDLHDAFEDDAPDRALGILGDLEGIVGEVRARIGQRVGMALAGQLRGCATIMAHDTKEPRQWRLCGEIDGWIDPQ